MKTRTALASLLAIALLAWFLRGTDLGSVAAQWQHASPGYLVAALLFVGATYWARALRWQRLLAPIGATTFRTAFRTTIIGFAALGLLPARAGDILRPYLLARQERLNLSSTIATIVMERVLDLVTVLVLLAVYVWGFADPGALPPRAFTVVEVSAAVAGAAAIVLLVLMWVLATHPERIGRLVFTAHRVLPHRLAHKLAGIASAFSSGFAAARDARGFASALAWSFALWLGIAAETWCVTRAFGIAMPFSGTYLLQALLVIGVATPTPGAVGGYHAAYRYGVTTFFHAPNDSAVAAAIVVHAVSFVPVVLAGLLFMAQDGLTVARLRDLSDAGRHAEEADSDEVPLLRSSGR